MRRENGEERDKKRLTKGQGKNDSKAIARVHRMISHQDIPDISSHFTAVQGVSSIGITDITLLFLYYLQPKVVGVLLAGDHKTEGRPFVP